MKKGLSKIRFSRIKAKLFAIIMSVLILFLIMIGTFSTPILFRVFSHQTYNRLIDIGNDIALCSPNSVTYYFDLHSIAVNNNVSFEILSSNGLLTYTSAKGSSAQSSEHFPSSTNYKSTYSQTEKSTNYDNIDDHLNFEIRRKIGTSVEYFVYNQELSSGESVYIYSELADVVTTADVAGRVFSSVSIIFIFILSLIVYIAISKFTKPLVEMNDITKKMAALDFKERCGNYGKDEIGELGKSINILSTTLNSTLVDLKDKNKQLEKDIERRHSLDNARKSFISNVSHELKTPIAIISGYAEGLCEGISDDPAVIKEYCQIINDESQKMNALVVELLELSKLESQAQTFEPAYFDLGRKISSLLSHLSLQFERNGITVINNIPSSLNCYAQEDKIEIVLKNYITNAVSHCTKEKQIVIGSRDLGETVEITVFNTGENISEHDLPELWDSFYRADKAHGRSESRFGLGLSIVKSIMDSHKCNYGVANTENGVVFRFEVSKDSSYYDGKK